MTLHLSAYFIPGQDCTRFCFQRGFKIAQQLCETFIDRFSHKVAEIVQ